jgi:hypothetical protein
MNELSSADKQCPYCGETIKAIAIKCKHCKSDLSEQKELLQIEMKDCIYCGESIENHLSQCPHCKSDLNTSTLQREIENTWEVKSEISVNKNPELKQENISIRKILIFSGYIALVPAVLNLILFKTDPVLAIAIGFLPTLIFQIFVAVIYTKDRKHIGNREISSIPWYCNLFFVFFIPFISVPLYLKWYENRFKVSSSVLNSWIGWGVGIISSIIISWYSIFNGGLMGMDFANLNNKKFDKPSESITEIYGKNFMKYLGMDPLDFFNSKNTDTKFLFEGIGMENISKIKEYFAVVPSPIFREGDFIIGLGCKQHECASRDAIFYVDTKTNFLAIFTSDQKIYANGYTIGTYCYLREAGCGISEKNNGYISKYKMPMVARKWFEERGINILAN